MKTIEEIRAAKLEWLRADRKKNPERYRKYSRKGYLKHAEKKRAYSRAYRQGHRAEVSEYNKKYQERSAETIYAKVKEWRQKNWLKCKERDRKVKERNRRLVFEHYGMRCACCGESREEFLSIDHINGRGKAHAREVGGGSRMYLWLIRNKFPEGFRTLCYNCNCARGFRGYCPHEREKLHIVKDEKLPERFLLEQLG